MCTEPRENYIFPTVHWKRNNSFYIFRFLINIPKKLIFFLLNCLFCEDKLSIHSDNWLNLLRKITNVYCAYTVYMSCVVFLEWNLRLIFYARSGLVKSVSLKYSWKFITGNYCYSKYNIQTDSKIMD